MINYNQYPIGTSSTSEYEALVKTCKEQLCRDGFVSLRHFLEPSSVDALVSGILDIEKGGGGFYSTERHNVFLEDHTPSSLHDNEINTLHPRHIQLNSSKLIINAKDLAPHAAELNNLFYSSTFLDFICDVLQTKLYPSIDEYGKYYANIFHEGDGLNFHFDRSEFSISLILQPAEQGGKFEFVPNSRHVVEEWREMPLNTKDLQNALDPNEFNLHVPELAAGDLYLFHGQKSLHRVSEVVRGTRINVILTFNTAPESTLNSYTLKKFFGVET